MRPMLWLRGVIFTLLVPFILAVIVPASIDGPGERRGGLWNMGWVLVAAGELMYGSCLLRFLVAGGTPAIFFTRHLRFLLGEEPDRLVSAGLYRFTRNPMYVAALIVVLGQAVLFSSVLLALYGCVLFVFFHIVVVFGEEPHLRVTRGPSYADYCREVPRWLGMPKGRQRPPETSRIDPVT